MSAIMRLVKPDSAPDADVPLLSVENLCIDLLGRSGQAGLVQDASFTVMPGRTLALIGESGCGKTITALAILGLLPASMQVASGRIMFGGQDLAHLDSRTLRSIRGGRIGTVFQDPMSSLDPTMTVGDQIGEARRLHLGEKPRVARQHARRLLDTVGIADADRRINAYPHELSGGMQQRVMIAAAISCEPQLLIADEPTTALDVTIQADMLDLFRDLQRDLGLAMVLVTHDLGVVADFCDDVAVMYAGHVVDRAPVLDIFARPGHPYTAALLGAVPHLGQARTALTVIPGRVPPAGEFPTGCRFQPRCRYAEPAACSQPQPEFTIAAGHTNRCVRVAVEGLSLGPADD
jgi:peptide/nickel transport system ATP-binding protein